MRRLVPIIAVALVVLGIARARADEPRFKVIVHPDNAAAAISRDFLRDAYLRKATDWRGATLRPVDLSSKFSVREQFTRDVIRKTPSQLRTYWNQQVFSGKGVPPPEVDSFAAVVAYVLAHPGAVGYVPIEVDHGRAKVIEIR